jgi:hypothetical protein
MTPYRKRGSVVRYEHGVIVRVDEAGEAREVGEEFIASPFEAVPGDELPSEEILQFVSGVFGLASGEQRAASGGTDARLEADPARRSQSARLAVERLVVSEGVAEHEYGEVRWRDVTRRVHLSLTCGSHRALLDFADFDLVTVARVAKALARVGSERTLERVRLAPNVTAALLPSLIGTIELEQLPGGHDGYGAAVPGRRVTGVPPDWFRPSYRLRPVRAWHNLRAVPFGALDAGAPEAIALLAPPTHTALRVLCIDGGDVFPAMAGVTSVRAAGDAAGWYPYAAGAFGAEMLL